jgi:hypothetical protein
MGKGDYMKEHSHAESSFFGVHYLKFNNAVHTPTILKNPNTVSQYSSQLLGRLYDLDDSLLENSWTQSDYYLGVGEGDFIIAPSVLRHYVLPSSSDEHRITIVLNIKLE